MDCCGNHKSEERKEVMKGGKGMETKKSTLIWIIVGALLLATIFLTIKTSSLGAETAQATASVARTAASSASSGMVGGC